MAGLKEALADNFITTMNRAAEEAVPAALEQFQGAISAMSMDGLFSIVAQEEARIREDPVARSTERLKKVFGGS